MVKFITNPMSNQSKGFTLIEVLIALVILAIALTAIIKATSEDIKNTLYLQNKTISAWVANELINEVRANVLSLPTAPDHLTEETTFLGESFKADVSLQLTANAHIQKINVSVYEQPSENKIISMTGYQYVN